MVKRFIARVLLFHALAGYGLARPVLPTVAAMQAPMFRAGKTGSGCTSGAFIDNFTGPANQALSLHNPAYQGISSTYADNFVLTGSGAIDLNNVYATAGVLLSCSNSETAQATFIAAPSADHNNNRQVCVDANGATGGNGYCVSGGYADGSTPTKWGHIIIFRNGTQFDVNTPTGSWDPRTTHLFRISVTRGASTTIQTWVDGVLIQSVTDSSPLSQGHPALICVGDGQVGDNQFTGLKDY